MILLGCPARVLSGARERLREKKALFFLKNKRK